MKKNILALTLALSMGLSLAGCAKKEEAEVPEEPPVTIESSEEVVETASSSVEEPAPEPLVAEEAGPVNPLTGEETETDISANRPYAFMMNSLKQALPQTGQSKADMWIEMTEEGGITRVMALYQDITGIGKIGPIRSTRHYFLEMAISMDAIVCHAGGAMSALALIDDYPYPTLNALKNGGSLYYRDKDRLAQGYALEHTMYTNTDDIQKFMADQSDIPTTHEADFTPTYKFGDNCDPSQNAFDANEAEVSFSDYKQTKFVYNPDDGKYGVYFFGEPYMDAGENQQVETQNVVAILCEEITVQQDGPREVFALGNGGTGYYLSNGKAEKITWKKGVIEDKMKLYHEDGSELVLNKGKTYMTVCDDNRPITIDGTNVNAENASTESTDAGSSTSAPVTDD